MKCPLKFKEFTNANQDCDEYCAWRMAYIPQVDNANNGAYVCAISAIAATDNTEFGIRNADRPINGR